MENSAGPSRYLTEARDHSHDLSEWSHLHDVLKLLVHVADREFAVLDLVDQLFVVVWVKAANMILPKIIVD